MSRKMSGAERTSLASFAEDVWLPAIRQSRASWQTDQRIAGRYILPALGDMELAEIGADDVCALMERFRREGSRASTRNRILAVLKSIYSVARKTGLIGPADSPVANMPGESVPRRRPAPVPPEKLAGVIAALENSGRLEARFILLMLYTSAGKAELLQARWENFSAEERTLLLERKYGPLTRRREVPLTREAVEIIASLPRREGSPWLFPGQNPQGHLSDIYHFWNALRRECGLPGLKLHDLQMAFVVCQIRHGAHTRALNEIFGYSFTWQARRIAAGA